MTCILIYWGVHVCSPQRQKQRPPAAVADTYDTNQQPPYPTPPPLITSHLLKSGHSVRLYRVNHSESGGENLLHLFPDQSKPVPAFFFGLGSENAVGLSSQWSSPVTVSPQWTTEVASWFCCRNSLLCWTNADGWTAWTRSYCCIVGRLPCICCPLGTVSTLSIQNKTPHLFFSSSLCFSVKHHFVETVSVTFCLLHPDICAKHLL